MRLRIHFESPVRAVVCAEPSWLGALLGREADVRFADCHGWLKEWRWAATDRLVPEDVAEQIERAWLSLRDDQREHIRQRGELELRTN